MSLAEDETLPIVADAAAAAPTTAPAPVSAPLNPPPAGLPVVTDDGLAEELQRIVQGTGDALVIANAYTVCLLHRDADGSPWLRRCCGEFGEAAVAAGQQLIRRRRLWWARTAAAPWEVDPVVLEATKATGPALKGWVRTSHGETTGREGDVTSAIKEELVYLAAWRCQFAGCGRDLKRHGATGSVGRYSYFAHIVAASPNGPRGHAVESRQLASELSNFLLLCDECHRLIDKINPAKYTVETLRKMREDSIAEVRRLLGNLQYQPAEVLAFIGNITSQSPQFSMDDAEEAMWGSRLRSADVKPQWFFQLGGHHHDVHDPAYWASLFQVMKHDIVRLQALLNGTSEGGRPRPRLAVFPMHGTSVLLLAGRLLGDTAGTHLFQPHRNHIGAATRWAWPPTGSLPQSAPGKFKVETLVPHAPGQEEACLIVALTSDIDASRMPSPCAAKGRLLLPTLRITGPTFDKDCMEQPDDVQLLGLAVDAAVRRLQDEWHVRKVHLFVSAPASAVVAVGQKMQARHQAAYVCHEASGGPGSAYRATIEISSASVRELVSGQAQSLSLQS